MNTNITELVYFETFGQRNMAPKESSDPKYIALQKEIEALKEKIKSSQQAARDAELDQVALSVAEVPKLKLQPKRTLKGHIHKVNGVAFSGDSRYELNYKLWHIYTINVMG